MKRQLISLISVLIAITAITLAIRFVITGGDSIVFAQPATVEDALTQAMGTSKFNLSQKKYEQKNSWVVALYQNSSGSSDKGVTVLQRQPDGYHVVVAPSTNLPQYAIGNLPESVIKDIIALGYYNPDTNNPSGGE